MLFTLLFFSYKEVSELVSYDDDRLYQISFSSNSYHIFDLRSYGVKTSETFPFVQNMTASHNSILEFEVNTHQPATNLKIRSVPLSIQKSFPDLVKFSCHDSGMIMEKHITEPDHDFGFTIPICKKFFISFSNSRKKGISFGALEISWSF